jgi:hypothetical protein
MLPATFSKPFPEVAALAPSCNAITLYDQSHLITYARLLSDERAGIGWAESAQTILRCHVEKDVDSANACWRSHLDRAQWLISDGLQHLIVH